MKSVMNILITIAIVIVMFIIIDVIAGIIARMITFVAGRLFSSKRVSYVVMNPDYTGDYS